MGGQVSAHTTSLGKVLLSSLSDAAFDELFAGVTLEQLTAKSINSLDALKQALAQVWLQGYAMDQGETLEEAGCVGAAVHDASGTIVAAMSITVPITRMDARRALELAKQVQVSAQHISLKGLLSKNGSQRIKQLDKVQKVLIWR